MDMTNQDGRPDGAAGFQPEDTARRSPVGGAAPSPPPPTGAVDLHIEQLVLHGLLEIDTARLSGLVERELVRLLATHGAPPSWTQRDHATHPNGATIDLAIDAGIARIARQIALGIYRGMRT